MNVSETIIDLEDAVKFSERELIIEQMVAKTEYRNFYIRIPLYNEAGKIDAIFLKQLYKNGFRKFVFPKIQKAADLKSIISKKEYKKIVFQELELEVTISCLKLEDLNNLEDVRLQILYLARIMKIDFIDIASMEFKKRKFCKR